MHYVYCLRNWVNGKVYVGYSANPPKRWEREQRSARYVKDGDHSTRLSRAIRKHGWESFDKEILEAHPDKKSALDAERKWVAQLRSTELELGYNMVEGGGMPPSHKGKKRSAETLKKMGAAQKGKTISPETRKKLSDFNKGRKLSEESKLRLSKANKGKSVSKETGEKISKAKKGKKFTEEHKQALSEARKRLVASGWTPPNKGVSGVVRQRPEVGQKISEALKGRPQSEEHRANVVAALKESWRLKKQALE